MGICMADWEADNRPGTNCTLHLAGLRGERPGVCAGRSGHLEMLRHGRARAGKLGMHQAGGCHHRYAKPFEIIDGSKDVHSR